MPLTSELNFLLVYVSNLKLKVRLWLRVKQLVFVNSAFLPQALLAHELVLVVVYLTPSEGWGHGGRPWSPRSRATPQDLDQRS